MREAVFQSGGKEPLFFFSRVFARFLDLNFRSSRPDPRSLLGLSLGFFLVHPSGYSWPTLGFSRPVPLVFPGPTFGFSRPTLKSSRPNPLVFSAQSSNFSQPLPRDFLGTTLFFWGLLGCCFAVGVLRLGFPPVMPVSVVVPQVEEHVHFRQPAGLIFPSILACLASLANFPAVPSVLNRRKIEN